MNNPRIVIKYISVLLLPGKNELPTCIKNCKNVKSTNNFKTR